MRTIVFAGEIFWEAAALRRAGFEKIETRGRQCSEQTGTGY